MTLSGRVLSRVTTDEYVDYENPDAGVNSTTYPAYTIWKLNLSQRVHRGIRVNATVDNLFNYRPDHYYNSTPATTGTTFSVGLSLDVDQLF